MKKIFLSFIIGIICSILISCGDDLKPSKYTKGFEIANVSIDNDNLGIKIDFKYYKSLDIDEYNQLLNEKIDKIGIIISYNDISNIDDLVVGNKNQFEIEFDKNDEHVYLFLFNKELENNYKKNIVIRLYYKYIDDTIKYRYSDTYYKKSIYDLAILESGLLSDKIIDAYKEEINLISLKLDYKNYVVNCYETNYNAEILKPLDYQNILILVSISDEVRLSEDFVVSVNDITIDKKDYSINDNKITINIKDNKVFETNISINLDTKSITVNNDFDLEYNFSNDVYDIKLTLKEGLLHPDFVLKVNEEIINKNNYTIDENQILIKIKDERIKEANLKVDFDNKKVIVDSNFNFSYSFYEDEYNIKLTLKEGLLHPEFKLIVNNNVINKDNYIINNNDIIVTVVDRRIKEANILIDFDLKKVTVNELFNLEYNVLDNLYSIKLVLKEGSLHPNFTLYLNGKIINTNQYNINNQTISYNYLDNYVREIKVYLDTTNYVVSTDSSQCTVKIKTPLDYIDINTIITIKKGLILDDNFKLIVNNKEIDSNLYSVVNQEDGIVILYRIDDPNWTKPY